VSRCLLSAILVLLLAPFAWAEAPEVAATGLLKALGAPIATLEPRPSDYDTQRGLVSFASSGVLMTVKKDSGQFVAFSVFAGAPWLPKVSARGVEPTTEQVNEVTTALAKAFKLQAPVKDITWAKTTLPTGSVWWLGNEASSPVWGLIIDKAGRLLAFASEISEEASAKGIAAEEALAAVKAEVPDLPASAKARRLGGLWRVGWLAEQGDCWASDVEVASGKVRFKPVQIPKSPACYATDWRSVTLGKQAAAPPPAPSAMDNLFDTTSEPNTDYGSRPPVEENSGMQTGLLIASVLLAIGIGLWLYIRMKQN